MYKLNWTKLVLCKSILNVDVDCTFCFMLMRYHHFSGSVRTNNNWRRMYGDPGDRRTFVGVALSCRAVLRSLTTKSVGYPNDGVRSGECTDRYKLIQIGLPGLALQAQTVLRRPAIYRKTPAQSGANLTVYIRTISGRVDLTCILYIVYFCIFLRFAPGLAWWNRFQPGMEPQSILGTPVG